MAQYDSSKKKRVGTTAKNNGPATGAAGTHRGMQATPSSDARASGGNLQTPNDASLQASLELPHERDQQADSTGGQPSTKMKQAGRDLSHGVQDTSRAPEMNRAYEQVKKQDGSA